MPLQAKAAALHQGSGGQGGLGAAAAADHRGGLAAQETGAQPADPLGRCDQVLAVLQRRAPGDTDIGSAHRAEGQAGGGEQGARLERLRVGPATDRSGVNVGLPTGADPGGDPITSSGLRNTSAGTPMKVLHTALDAAAAKSDPGNLGVFAIGMGDGGISNWSAIPSDLFGNLPFRSSATWNCETTPPTIPPLYNICARPLRRQRSNAAPSNSSSRGPSPQRS